MQKHNPTGNLSSRRSAALQAARLILIALTPAAFGIPPCARADEGLRLDVSPDFTRSDHLSPRLGNWTVKPSAEASFQQNGVTLILRPSNTSSSLSAEWWKAGLDFEATLASDGVFVKGKSAGLELTLRGLSAGRHSLVTYHNSIWDHRVNPIDIMVNGSQVVAKLVPSQRATDDADVASAIVEFSVRQGEDIVVHFQPHPSPTDPSNQRSGSTVILNGLEIDTVDPQKKALKPLPAHGDLHVPASPILSWRAAATAVAHDVYLGNNYAAVSQATSASPEYMGRHQANSYATAADDHFADYYWRVDEFADSASAEVTKGDVWHFRVRHLAFPEAEGYGRFAIGGRGGRVIKVTNLRDSGHGSLRAAVEAEGPRTIVFDVSGRIVLKSKLIIRNPFMTIAGQTAPGKGICVSNFNLGMLGTHDAIVRYLRVRPGDTAGVTLDGMGMASTDHSIIDHCSISWTQDEAFSSRSAKNITLQRTLISEALNVAGHKKYEPGKQHGFAASIGGDIGSFHRNLLAHCAGRNWSLAGGLNKAGRHTGRLDIRNNLVYNWGHRTTDGGALEVNFVNNYYKPGPASRVFHVLKPEGNQIFGAQHYYVAGNVMEGRYDADHDTAGVRLPSDGSASVVLADAPLFESQVPTLSAHDAFENVLADVGCNRPVLDDHDRRVLQETKSGTATYTGSQSGLPGLPDSQQDVGGWEDYPEVHRSDTWDADHDGMPTHWEREHGFDPDDPSDGRLDTDGDGYTNLEEYLNGTQP